MNLGDIYKELGNLEQAHAYTLKSLELKVDNPNALSKLCNISSKKDLQDLNRSPAEQSTKTRIF